MILQNQPKLNAQIAFDSLFVKPSSVITKIPKLTTDIECDQEGNLFLLQPGKHKLHKLFASSAYDSILTIGGKGSGKEGFNNPTKLVMPNRQNLFMLDFQNRRIALLNTNLKVMRFFDFMSMGSELSSEDQDFLYPLSFAAGPTGEVYLLNQDDNKIYKFTSDGKFQLAFGGLDYGKGSLIAPDDICLNNENFVFVSDTVHQKISVFDFYGIFQYGLQFNLDFKWDQMLVFDNYLILFNSEHIFFWNLLSKKEKIINLPAKEKLIDLTANKEHFFLLFENGIKLYPTSR